MPEVEAAYAMNVLGNQAEPAFPALTNLFFKGKHSVGAAISLAGMGRKGVLVLLEALTNQNPVATCALGYARSDSEIIIPALIQVLRSDIHSDNQSVMRYGAITALGLLHSKPELSIPALVESFDDPDELQRAGVATALGEFGTKAKAAVPLLLRARKDKDEHVREFAEKALRKISPESLAAKESK